MLRNTFQHVKGIGRETERILWENGVLSWDCLLSSSFPRCPVRINLDNLKKELEFSSENLQRKNIDYFTEHLPVKEVWRLFPHFRDTIAYLDIETTGLSEYDNYITTISIYDGNTIKYYVQGINLNDFVDDIQCYNLLVTYNGKTFDVPWLESYFNIKMPMAHIDLRYVLSNLGYKGGLKKCEKRLGIDRGELDGIDGFFGVKLWFDYLENKNYNALETLLAYNIEDVVNLELILTLAYNFNLCNTPFQHTHKLALTEKPDIPFTADAETVERLMTPDGFFY